MNSKRKAAAALATAALTAVALTACTSSQSSDSSGEYVSGGTFVTAMSGDPGSLVPMTGISLEAREIISFHYESLVYVNADGELLPWLAESWEEDASSTSITYTLKDGITCADGTPFTAETAAANITYNADPANATFYYGAQVSERMTATADGNQLTVTSSTPDPFILANTGTVEMVCQAGLDDPGSLVETMNGTGLFTLDKATPGSSYTFTKRDDYTWGPEDVTSDTKGLPDTFEVRVVTDPGTAANLLLSGDVNAASIGGADQDRVEAAGLGSEGVRNPIGEMLFNERPERPTSDPLVREALVTAIDREQVGEVVTDGTAEESKSLVVKSPYLCVADGPQWTLPETDVEKSGELLDEAGWKLGSDGKRSKDGEPLTIKFIYDAATPSHAAAAELVQQTWDELGVTTELSGNDANAWSEQLFSTFDWDTGFVQIAPGGPVIVNTFFGGETPDKGGNNFMFVDNPEYDALAEQAKTASPEETCDLWQQAEAKLIERTDVFPIADAQDFMYLNGAEVERPNFIRPTSIRMVG